METALSKLALHPTAPMITLYAGEGRIEYYAHEEKLCKLPFFQAALHGGFKEALEKSINMPEDDPAAVSALIGWLYNGKYTYNRNRLQETTLRLREAADRSGNFHEGLFHLEVYVIGSKYECTALMQDAKIRYYSIWRRLDDFDSLWLFRAACTTDLPASQIYLLLDAFNSDEYLLERRIVMTRSRVRRLFEESDEEVRKVLEEFPILATSLLRTATLAILEELDDSE